MSKEVAVLATVAAGGVVALQAPANNVLSKHLGSFGAAVASFSVGLIVIVVVTFAFAGGIQDRRRGAALVLLAPRRGRRRRDRDRLADRCA